MNGLMLMEIQVACHEAIRVNGQTRDIVMIPFEGSASGPYFTGRTVGQGVDTQKISKDGICRLSARYMLEGKDAAGNACRVFIENEGIWKGGFRPTVVTDSPLLKSWETSRLSATVNSAPGGVTVRIYLEPQED